MFAFSSNLQAPHLMKIYRQQNGYHSIGLAEGSCSVAAIIRVLGKGKYHKELGLDGTLHT